MRVIPVGGAALLSRVMKKVLLVKRRWVYA